MVRLLLGLALIMTGCGPHQSANVNYAIDCFDGCSKDYQEYVDEFKGDQGDEGPQGETGARSTVAGPRGESGESGRDGVDGIGCTIGEFDEGEETGAVITCGDESVVVYDGDDGEDGIDAAEYYCRKVTKTVRRWHNGRYITRKVRKWKCTNDDE